MARFTSGPSVKLNPRNFRCCGRATVLFAAFTLCLCVSQLEYLDTGLQRHTGHAGQHDIAGCFGYSIRSFPALPRAPRDRRTEWPRAPARTALHEPFRTTAAVRTEPRLEAKGLSNHAPLEDASVWMRRQCGRVFDATHLPRWHGFDRPSHAGWPDPSEALP